MSKSPRQVNAKYITRDLDRHIGEAVKAVNSDVEPVNLNCTHHLLQSQHNRTQGMDFSDAMFPGKTKQSKNSQQRQFSYYLSRRCTAEFNLCYDSNCGDIVAMRRKLTGVTRALILCFQGKHSACRRNSFVCSGRAKGKWNMSFLPAGRLLNISDSDEQKLKDLISIMLGLNAINATRFNTSTQKVESVNRAYSRTNPKNVTWSRNVHGRIHTAAHMLNCNFENSTLKRLEAMGAPVTAGSTVVRQLRSVTMKNQYNREYQQSKKHKMRRAATRINLEYLHRQKQNVKDSDQITYKRDHGLNKLFPPKSDHNYSMKPGLQCADHSYARK